MSQDGKGRSDGGRGLAEWGRMPVDSSRSGGSGETRVREGKKGGLGRYMAKGYFDMIFCFLVFILLAFGLVMLYSASNVYAYQYEGDSAYYLMRQLGYALVGVVAMLAISCVDYHVLKKLAVPLYLVGLVLLVIVLFMPKRGGAHRWIFIGGFSFQPSELMKFFIILVYARYVSDLSKKNDFEIKIKSFKRGAFPFLAIFAPVAGLLALEPHMSGIVLFLALMAVMMWIAGVHWKWFFSVLIVIAAGLVVLIVSETLAAYMYDRVEFWLDPWADPLDKGFQTIQSLYSIGSGGLFGVGLGNSRQKHLYIPEPQNDFIFAVVCEELGLLGALLVIALFVFLVWRGLKIAMRAKDKFGTMLAAGLTLQVGIQALLNIAVVTNTIPNTGISLPFFSSGGTSLMMMLAQMGVVLSISRTSALEKKG